MIHYHGTPITPDSAALELLKKRHAFVSFQYPQQMETVAEVCQTFSLDCGAYTVWKNGGEIDVKGYAQWVDVWRRHPGYDWCLIPDIISGGESENDRMFAVWRNAGGDLRTDVPVWHMHESLERLQRLCRTFPRVALGSSGQFADVGTDAWWQRMGEAMDGICDENGRPPCKLHGLRMLDPTIFSQLPLSSADSTNIARNIGIDQAWDRSAYAPKSRSVRALIMADRIEHHASAARWTRTFSHQHNMELFG